MPEKIQDLKGALRKTHGLKPQEYAQKYNLDLIKYPLVCKEYSEQRSKLAKDRGLGADLRGRRTANES